MSSLVTGATGLLGSHIVEQLVRGGEKVRCLVRKTSDTSFLDMLDVEKVVGDITDPDSLVAAFRGIEIVYHCAARVTEWGPWREFERTTIEGTKNCLEAALHARTKRFVYIGTQSIYGYHKVRPEPIQELTPLPRAYFRWDHYTRSKFLAEELVWKFVHGKGLEVTVLRPGWIYGPRDNFSLKRLVRFLRSPLAGLIDGGTNFLNLVHAADVAQAAILAATEEAAQNQVYNIQSDERITAHQFISKLSSLINAKSANRSFPRTLAFMIASFLELLARLKAQPTPPLLTRYAVVGISCKNIFDVSKAKRELGWTPNVSFERGIAEAMEWCLQALGEKHAREYESLHL